MRLSAAKSALGHTETAAGAIGICQAAANICGSRQPELLHLRNLNSYVASTFDATASAAAPAKNDAAGKPPGIRSGGGGHCGFAAQRQQAPMVAMAGASEGGATDEAAGGAVGVSAFAFQGTNAHVLLSVCSFGKAQADSNNSTGVQAVPALWDKRRYWYAPPPSALLVAVASSGSAGGAAAVFLMQLRAPCLAYLHDHQVKFMPKNGFTGLDTELWFTPWSSTHLLALASGYCSCFSRLGTKNYNHAMQRQQNRCQINDPVTCNAAGREMLQPPTFDFMCTKRSAPQALIMQWAAGIDCDCCQGCLRIYRFFHACSGRMFVSPAQLFTPALQSGTA